MTTIAIKDGVVTSDTLVCDNFINQVKAEKIFKIENPQTLDRKGEWLIVGGSGALVEVLAFKHWVEYSGRKESYPKRESSSFFILDEEGVWSYEDNHHAVFSGRIYALGSGSSFAMGALMHGASPREAVKVAMQLDPYTGGDIIKLEL